MSGEFDGLRDIDAAEAFIVSTMKLHPSGIKLSLLIESAVKEGFHVLTASRALRHILDSENVEFNSEMQIYLSPKLPEDGT